MRKPNSSCYSPFESTWVLTAASLLVGSLIGCGGKQPAVEVVATQPAAAASVQPAAAAPAAQVMNATEGSGQAAGQPTMYGSSTNGSGSSATVATGGSNSEAANMSGSSGPSLSSGSNASSSSYNSSQYSGGASYSGSGGGSSSSYGSEMSSPNSGLVGNSPVDSMKQFANLFAASKESSTHPSGSLAPKDYLGQAKLAYGMGAESRAEDLYLAHLAIEPDSAAEGYGKTMISELLKKPVWHLRWGIAANVERRDYDGNAFPPVNDMKTPQVKDNTPGGGTAMSSAIMDASRSSDLSIGGGFGGASGPTTDMAKSILEQSFGVVPSVIERGFTLRYTRGDYGFGLSSMAPTAPGFAEPNSTVKPQSTSSSESMSNPSEGAMRNMPSSSPALATSAPAMAGIVAETPRFCPGMVFVGEGKRDAMLEKSRELKLEFLFMLESRVERNRGNGVVLNDIQVRLFQIASGNVIATSKPINNVEIFKNQKRRSATEVVDDAINNIFLVVDKKVKCLPMPKLPPEQVRSRIASLVIVPPPQRLASLAEIRMYHAQGSLTDDELLIAIEMLLGEQGLLLMAGTEEQQREILDTWAHRLSGS